FIQTFCLRLSSLSRSFTLSYPTLFRSRFVEPCLPPSEFALRRGVRKGTKRGLPQAVDHAQPLDLEGFRTVDARRGSLRHEPVVNRRGLVVAWRAHLVHPERLEGFRVAVHIVNLGPRNVLAMQLPHKPLERLAAGFRPVRVRRAEGEKLEIVQRAEGT